MNFQYLKRGEKYNIINLNQKPNNESLNFYLDIGKNQKKYHNKTYFSPDVYRSIERTWIKDLNDINFFSVKDFINFNIFPFNYYFKMSEKNRIRKSDVLLHSNLYPKISDIENNLFFDLFNIENLLIFDNENSEIDLKNFEIIKKINLNDKNLIKLKKLNNSKIIVKDLSNFQFLNQIKCDKIETNVECILKNENYFEKNKKILLNRIKINNYEILNNNENIVYYVLPFLYDSNWKSDQKILNIKNTLMAIKLVPGKKVEIYYQNNLRFLLKFIGIIALLFLGILIIKKNA